MFTRVIRHLDRKGKQDAILPGGISSNEVRDREAGTNPGFVAVFGGGSSGRDGDAVTLRMGKYSSKRGTAVMIGIREGVENLATGAISQLVADGDKGWLAT